MARNEQRRQKKLEAKRVKRKEQSREVARAQSMGLDGRMELASCWPVFQAQVSATLWQQGIGQVVLVRRGSNGLTAIAVFLVDTYCLGVKDAFARTEPSSSAANLLSRLAESGEGWINVTPEHVRKLVEQAIGYALSLGLAPHRDCAAAMKLFGDLDASQCKTEFTFGRDGKPCYIAGPHDSEVRVREILQALRETCGPDRFHYTVPLPSSDLSREMIEVLEDINPRILDLQEPDDDEESPG